MITDSCKLAIDIGGTSIKYGLVKSNHVIYCSEMSVDSTASFAEIIHVFQAVINCARKKAEETGYCISSVGVSVPGPFDYKRGASMMKHKYVSLYDIPLREYISEPLAQNVPITFISDAGAFLLGALQILQIDNSRVCSITIGTGIGFACTENGKLKCNEAGGPFLRLFSMPYRDGCVEDYISKRAIVSRYKSLGGLLYENESVKEIAIRARDNETAAKMVFSQVGSDIIIAMTPIMRQYQFSTLVIGGQIAKACDLMIPAMQKELKKLDYQYDICPAGEITQAALLGSVQEQ